MDEAFDKPTFESGSSLIFEKILRALADTDAFEQDAPSIFVVYAHNNPKIGQAHSDSVIQLIHWLKEIRARVLSDQSTQFRRPFDQRDEGISAVSDVLVNQFCLLPRGPKAHRGVDKVVVCCSEVLNSYYKNPRMTSYRQAILDDYNQGSNDDLKNLHSRMRDIQIQFRNNDDQKDFHNVVTELAFLECHFTKKTEREQPQIIPLVFNDVEHDILPIFCKNNAVRVKCDLSSHPSIATSMLRKTFFKLLAHMYTKKHQIITEFRHCYESCVKRLREDTPTDIEIDTFTTTQIHRAQQQIISHNSATIRSMRNQATTPSMPDLSLKKKYIDSLLFPEIHNRRDEIVNAAADSCTWIETDSEFLDWRERGRGILGIRGTPGSGKSTLLKAIFRRLESKKAEDTIHLSYFFFGRGKATLQKSSAGMFRTLLYQLLSEAPEAGTQFYRRAQEKEACQKSTSDWVWGESEIRECLVVALLEASKMALRFRIFVDALDEDEAKDNAKETVRFLREIGRNLLEGGGCVAICFSCRHYPSINMSGSYEVHVEKRNSKDISDYVANELDQGLDYAPDRAAVLEELMLEIVEKASGVFLWAELVVPIVVTQWNDGTSISKSLARLEEVPKKLDDIYRHILTTVVDQSKLEKTLFLMQWVTFAMRTLTLEEIGAAFALDEPDQMTVSVPTDLSNYYAEFRGTFHRLRDSISISDREILAQQTQQTKRSIRSICGGLVEVAAVYSKNITGEPVSIVQFIHQTVKDFVINTSFGIFGEGSSQKFVGNCHDRMCQLCLKYHGNLKSMTEPIPRYLHYQGAKYLPFLSYAWEFWMEHASKAESCGIEQRKLVAQLSNQSSFWNSWNKGLGKLGSNEMWLWYSSVDSWWGNNSTIIHIASAKNLISAVMELISKKYDINETDGDGRTGLHYASHCNNEQVASLLLQGGARVNPRARKGITPLFEAIYRGNESIVRLLVDHNANINKVVDGKGSLDAVSRNGSLSILQFLLDKGLKIKSVEGSWLHKAANDASYDFVRILVQGGADVNSNDRGHWETPLIQASLREHDALAVIRLLLDAGAYVNDQSTGEYGSALQVAAQNYKGFEIVKLLIEEGADVNVGGGCYGSALQAAAQNENGFEIVKLLFEEGADVNNFVGEDYGSALQAAAQNVKGFEIVKLLIEEGADVNFVGEYFGSALQAAARSRNGFEIVKLLIEEGADVNVISGRYATALEASAQNWAHAIGKLLISSGADVQVLGGEYGNALAAAGFCGNLEFVQVLLDAGAIIHEEFIPESSVADRQNLYDFPLRIYGCPIAMAEYCSQIRRSEKRHYDEVIKLLKVTKERRGAAAEVQREAVLKDYYERIGLESDHEGTHRSEGAIESEIPVTNKKRERYHLRGTSPTG